MTPERWRQIEDVYHAALERGPGVLAGADPELRREVESLLAEDGSRAGMIEQPAISAETVAGTQFGPYRIEASIGKGVMGEVWKARDSRLNRDVAIKSRRSNSPDASSARPAPSPP
jgi:serine/threonine protein kinase